MPDTISDSILVARQAILDNNLNVYAYELLFRDSLINESGVDENNGDIATTQVINNTFMEFGIDRIVGHKRGFINLTRGYLTGEFPLPFDNSQVVLEILEDILVDEQIVNTVTDFAKQGFIIALDDFIYREELRPLIKIATIIKIDILALTQQELIEHVELLKNEDVTLLAEKVETEEQFKLCQQLGFTYYQGYFFCKPTIVDGKALPENKLSILRILNSLQDPNITIDDLELLVREDVSLSFKLLRFLNSAAFALPRKVDSIGQGLVFLGLKTIKSWATVISFSALAPKTNELMTTALIRAEMSSELASAFNCDKETAFMAGLFSLLDAILEKPMPEILESLPLENEMKEALLLNANTSLGKLLLFVISYEQGDLTLLPSTISVAELNLAYLAATELANLSESIL